MPKYCSECGSEIQKTDAKFCRNCGAQVGAPTLAQSPPVAHTENPAPAPNLHEENIEQVRYAKKKSPFLAAFLSFIFPGLGQIYNGQTKRGFGFFIFIVICAFFIFIGLSSSGLGILVLPLIVILPVVWLYGIYDAHKAAKLINQGYSVDELYKSEAKQFQNGQFKRFMKDSNEQHQKFVKKMQEDANKRHLDFAKKSAEDAQKRSMELSRKAQEDFARKNRKF